MLSGKRKFILVGIPVLLLSILPIMVWRSKPPKKPANISPGDYPSAILYAEQKIRWTMKQYHLPSAAVSLISDQDTIWQGTFGSANLETGAPARPDTVYKLWSVSKVFTAVEVMQLVEDGLVELDAPISEYLPGFSIHSRFADSDPITIRSILTHRSGLPRNECQWIEFSEQALVDLAGSLEDCYQAYPVNYRYKYSNIGFDLLGHVIERMRGELFPDYMRKHLLSPIGMDDSAFLRAQVPGGAQIASGYEYYKGEYYPYDQIDITSFPSSNLYSTLEDIGLFTKFIFRGGEANGEQILSTESLEEMFSDQVSNMNDPQPMGLGWKTANVLGSERLVWHDGGPGEGVGALIALLPERKLGVILFANGTSFEGSVSLPLALDLLEVLLNTKYGIQTPPEKMQTEHILKPEQLDKYVGKYAAFGDALEVTRNGDHLQGITSELSFNLVPLSETVFQPQHWLIDLGLAELVRVPLDLRQMRVEFMVEGDADDRLIINYRDIFFETCPKIPGLDQISLNWEDLTGEYKLVARLPGGDFGTDVLGTTSIYVEDGVLRMAGLQGPILPISESEIVILSGPFDGETMVRESGTGNLIHQDVVYLRR